MITSTTTLGDSPWRSAQLVRDGAALHWRAAGQGRPVLFIHGTAAAVWGQLPARVAGFARALVYDRRGFGASQGAPLSKLSPHAEDAAALIHAAGGGPAVLVGWSIGGVIALELAATQPALVAGLVLLEPPLHAKKHPDLNLLNGVVLSILTGALAGKTRGGRRFSRWVFRESDGSNSLDRVPADIRATLETNAAAICTELQGGTGEHLKAAQLAGIRSPTAVFAAGRSQAFLQAGARRAAQSVPKAELIELPEATHFLQLDAAERIARSVQRMVGA